MPLSKPIHTLRRMIIITPGAPFQGRTSADKRVRRTVLLLSRFETIWIEVGEDIFTEAMGNSEAPAAYRSYFAFPAG